MTKPDLSSLDDLFKSGFAGHKAPPGKKKPAKKRGRPRKAGSARKAKTTKPLKGLNPSVGYTGKDKKALTAEERKQLIINHANRDKVGKKAGKKSFEETCKRCHEEYTFVEGSRIRDKVCNRCDKEIGTLLQLIYTSREESYALDENVTRKPKTREEVIELGEAKEFKSMTNYEMREWMLTQESVISQGTEKVVVDLEFAKAILDRLVIGRFDKGVIRL